MVTLREKTEDRIAKNTVFSPYPKNLGFLFCTMVWDKNHQQLLYEREVMWARYDIREHYLKNIVCEVYDNISQALTLVRVQLSLISLENIESKSAISEPGILVGKAIDDLRHMCRSFYLERELLAKEGFVAALEYELLLFSLKEKNVKVKVNGAPLTLEAGMQLILFRMVQEILQIIRNSRHESIGINLDYKKNDFTITIRYQGRVVVFPVATNQDDTQLKIGRLRLPERAALLGGKLAINSRKPDITSVTIRVPYKIPFYE
jgi:signal transduction histidine kinase